MSGRPEPDLSVSSSTSSYRKSQSWRREHEALSVVSVTVAAPASLFLVSQLHDVSADVCNLVNARALHQTI